MARKGRIDWDVLCAQYRTGLFSNRALAEQYGIDEAAIRKRARNEGWVKDLTAQVQSEIQGQLDSLQKSALKKRQSATSPQCGLLSDREAVKQLATSGVQMIGSQRQSIKRARDNADRLLTALEGEEGLSLALEKQVTTLKELSNALRSLIELERKVWHLDKPEDSAPFEERLKRISAKHDG